MEFSSSYNVAVYYNFTVHDFVDSCLPPAVLLQIPELYNKNISD